MFRQGERIVAVRNRFGTEYIVESEEQLRDKISELNDSNKTLKEDNRALKQKNAEISRAYQYILSMRKFTLERMDTAEAVDMSNMLKRRY